MFFSGWYALLTIVVKGVLGYAAIVLLLRASGKRTLSKLNAFDFIVTVALGSTLASTLLSKSVTLADGIAGFVVLVALQYVITFVSVRIPAFEDAVKSEPTLLLRDGRMLEGALRRQRMTKHELLAALRTQGEPDVGAIAAVVLETDGTLSVIAGDAGDASALRDVPAAAGTVRS